MSREHRWFQIAFRLILPLLFLTVLPACKPLIEVTVHTQCGPEAVKDIPPTGCKRMPDGSLKC